MTCTFCGEPRFFEVLEVWEDGAWMLDACCEEYETSLQEDLDFAMELPAHERIRFLKPLRAELEEWGFGVRNVIDEDGAARLDYGLQVGTVEWETMRSFVARHHEHHPPPVGWKYGHGVYRRDTGELVAVSSVGRPVSAALARKGWLEVNRTCVDRSVGERAFNALSMLYAEAAREAARRGAPRIVTYTLEEESGGSLRAVGWTPEHTTKAESWHRDGRPREDKAPTCRKTRWGKDLKVAPPVQTTLDLVVA